MSVKVIALGQRPPGLYFTGFDVLTLGLWEVVGTPVETVASGTDVKVSVCYDTNGKVEKVTTYSGKEKVDEGIVPVAEGEGLGQQKIEEKYHQ